MLFVGREEGKEGRDEVLGMIIEDDGSWESIKHAIYASSLKRHLISQVSRKIHPK